MRILLTEGAGLTSRQVATRLDQLGHDVTAVVSDPFCLARFTRHVGTLQRGPRFGDDPMSWFDHALVVAERSGIDVVFPTQEQVAVLSHQLPRMADAGVRTAVPPFASLARVLDKVSARQTLDQVSIAQPRSVVVHDPSQLHGWSSFPAFVKAPLATGSTGVRRVLDHPALVTVVEHFTAVGAPSGKGVLVQEAVDGAFVMAQCVFDRGSLVAFHANERLREGANGSASAKVSVDQPLLRSDLARLGRVLDWHGALSVDAIVAGGQPYVIDVNPRLVEPGNALAAGTDLVAAFLAVATGTSMEPVAPATTGARTHQLLMAVLGVAQRTGRRRSVLVEMARAAGHRGVYAGSREELLPSRGDRRTIVPLVAAALTTVARPQWYRVFTDGAVSHYALSPAGWRQLCDADPQREVTAIRA